jgi:hypothetical protein
LQCEPETFCNIGTKSFFGCEINDLGVPKVFQKWNSFGTLKKNSNKINAPSVAKFVPKLKRKNRLQHWYGPCLKPLFYS